MHDSRKAAAKHPMDPMQADPIRERAPRTAARKASRRTAAPAASELPKLPPRRRQGPWLRRGLIFVTCVLMLDALFGDRGLAETIRVRRTHESAAQALSGLRHENAGLYEKARRLREDPDTIESVAREELGLVRPGEILVVVKDVK